MPQWRQAKGFFLSIWKKVVYHRRAEGATKFTVTPEFGPPPYLWTDSHSKPVADQWQLNLWMKDLLVKTLGETGDITEEW
jgi:hypothetical protein